MLILLIAVYAAMGTIPLSALFETLGGESWAPGRTFRHLPWVDLREGEYYSTAVFSTLLIALIINMALATALRIQWRWQKTGVITTHCGVIVLAVGAVVSTRDPLNATMTVWSDRPATVMLDRNQTVFWGRGRAVEGTAIGGMLPRYADFGTPWSDTDRVFQLSDRTELVGYAHSARLVSRLVDVQSGGGQAWQFTERLRSGESRALTLTTSDLSERVATLSDGTTVLAWSSDFPISRVAGILNEEQGSGAVWIRPHRESGGGVLPTVPGAKVEFETNEGLWRAEFLERTDAFFGLEAAVIRIEGPEFPSAIVFIGSWDPRVAGRLGNASEEDALVISQLPVGFDTLYADGFSDAFLLSSNGWLHAGSGNVVTGDALKVGQVIETSTATRLEIDRVSASAISVQELELLPFEEDAQLLADPRMNSWIRVRDRESGLARERWIQYDEVLSQPSLKSGFAFGPRPVTLTETDVRFKGFEAELFRRGSVPRDFTVHLQFDREDTVTNHLLRLNQPVRTSVRIDGRERRVQFSLIGWDSQGWEAGRGESDDAYQGTRFVILSINSREGVDTALAGGVLVLFGAGVSMAVRIRRRYLQSTPR